MPEYNKNKIIKTYWSVLIIDSCGEIYDELTKPELNSAIECGKYIIERKRIDNEVGEGNGTWDYRFVKHEEDEETDWQTIYKVYKYRGRWKYKRDTKF